MKKIIGILLIIGLWHGTSLAQDYFADRNNGGTPIIFKTDCNSSALFTANIDVSSQTSLKSSFYNNYWVNQAGFKKAFDAKEVYRHKNFFGWGLTAKGNTTNGTGNLFSSGAFSPGFNGGGYIAFTQMRWKPVDKTKPDPKNLIYSSWAVILSGNLNYAHEQFFQPSAVFANQLTEKTFNGNLFSLSGVYQLNPGKNDIFLGLSVSVGKIDNYSSLTDVSIKNDSLITGTGTTRTVTQVNKDGDVYEEGTYKSYTNFNIRANMTFIPGAIGNTFGATLYPSVDLSNAYHPKYNVGLALSYLKTGSPSTPVASLFFELDDLDNAAASTKPFISRSFKVGVLTSLNLFTGSK